MLPQTSRLCTDFKLRLIGVVLLFVAAAAQQLHTGSAYFVGAYLPSASTPATCQTAGLLPNGVPPEALYVALSSLYYSNGHACGCAVQYRSAPGDSANLFPSWVPATVISTLPGLSGDDLAIGLVTGVPDGSTQVQWEFLGNCDGSAPEAPAIAPQPPVDIQVAALAPPPAVTIATVSPPPPVPVVEDVQPVPPSPTPAPVPTLNPSPTPSPVAVSAPASPPPPTAIVSQVASSGPFVGQFSGDGTYYDATAPPGPQGFDCIQNGKPYAYGDLPTVALNGAQELANNRAACGMCLVLAGTGTGAGLNPISATPAKYVVSNQCPECKFGDIDIATIGNGQGKPALDGRWQITWSFVDCAGSKRRSSLRRRMLGITDHEQEYSSELDPEELQNLSWNTGTARFVAL